MNKFNLDFIRKNIFLNSLIGIALILVAMNLFIASGVKSVNSQVKALEDKQKKLSTGQRLINNFSEEEASLEEKNLDKRILPQAVLPVEAMRVVGDICRSLHITQVKLSVRKVSAKSHLSSGGVNILPFQADIVCKYEDLLSVLKKLAGAEIFINVEALSLKRNTAKLPMLEVNLLLNGFSLSGEKDKKSSPPGQGDFNGAGSGRMLPGPGT
jgi:hypothetical protein